MNSMNMDNIIHAKLQSIQSKMLGVLVPHRFIEILQNSLKLPKEIRTFFQPQPQN